MSIIKSSGLKYDYLRKDENNAVIEEVHALKGVDLEVMRGEFVAILGHNGSGKSTFAKHVNALLFPTGGTIWIEDRDTKDESALWDIRQTAGMVFQNPDNQIIASVVEEDVGFGPENMGVPSEEIWKRVAGALEAVGMTAYANVSPNRLSGGQKQRIAIAGVLAMKPRCIVLDEPTAMLDPEGRNDVMRTIHKLNREENITVLLITHNMEEAVDADRVIVMDSGLVVMDGTPTEIFDQAEALDRLGLAVPQVTELANALRKAGVPLPGGILKEAQLVEALDRIRRGGDAADCGQDAPAGTSARKEGHS